MYIVFILTSSYSNRVTCVFSLFSHVIVDLLIFILSSLSLVIVDLFISVFSLLSHVIAIYFCIFIIVTRYC